MDLTAYRELLPEITDANQPFWDGCEKGELRLQRCASCATYRFPDAPVCGRCLSEAFSWQAVSGRGRLWSWLMMHQRYFAAFADEVPYLVAFVKLEEGPFMMSTLCASSGPPAIDAPVRAVFEQSGAGRKIIRFTVAP